MSFDRDDFAEFFTQARQSDARPFRWQMRLLDHLLDTGSWPKSIDAPTGAGKTAVIYVHCFANALWSAGEGPRVPRRLALVVDRRALVDDQYRLVKELNARLAEAPSPLLGEVANALRVLRVNVLGDVPWSRGQAPILVDLLRGGTPPSRRWRDDPLSCGVLCATPDMWGSRVLMRGYGTNKRSWSREAGMLALDSTVVIDEAHLCRQLVVTARRVAQLQRSAPTQPTVPGLNVVEMTATPDTEGKSRVGVDESDLEHDAALQQRLCASKPVRLASVAEWPIPLQGREREAALTVIADETAQLHERMDDTVGCFVNNVRSATEIKARLEQRGVGTVVLLCGRLRPIDLDTIKDRYPGILTVEGNRDVDVIVATQTLEVGVDIDLAAAVSEIGPASALAQRAGRVNRLGRRSATEFVVVGPEAGSEIPERCWPYHGDDVRSGIELLARCKEELPGVSPWALRRVPAPPQTQRRTLYQRLEPADVWSLSRTSDRLGIDSDLELWLSDDFDRDTDVGVVVRLDIDDSPEYARNSVEAAPPQRHETFPCTIGTARALLGEILPEPVAYQPDDDNRKPVAVLVRGDDVSIISDEKALRPGDVVVLDSRQSVVCSDVVDDHPTDPAKDALESRPTADTGFVLRVGRGAVINNEDAERIISSIGSDLPDGDLGRSGRDLVASALKASSTARDERVVRCVVALGQRTSFTDVTVIRDSLGQILSLVIRDTAAFRHADRTRQAWTPKGEAVLLADHASAVGLRAKLMAQALGFEDSLCDILERAGLLHDEGKRDIRFQRRLAAPSPETILAKSAITTSSALRRAEASSGLPTRWRHEQLSAVLAATSCQDLDEEATDLVVRLAGTTHGHGRPSFPHTADQLLPADHPALGAAQSLFSDGWWDDMVERTDSDWGAWGVAYLEAVLRAADGQVSGEGS